MLKSRILGTASFAVVLAALGGPSAFAQAADAGAPEGRTIDELVVTAQKREQNLQDVPIVVTSVNAQQLQDAGVRDIKDLTVVAPGLTVTSTSNAAATTARIRGIGTVGDNAGLESSVGVVIDGVYRPRNGVALGDLGELERIEVLKGPQGTLFGKNTSAGVINVITARPSFTVGGVAELTADNFDGFGGSLSLTGPIVEEKAAGRIYVARRKRDGYYNGTLQPDSNDINFHTVRGQILLRPADTLDVLIQADWTKRSERCCGAVQVFNGPTAAIVNALRPGGLSNPPDIDGFVDYSNRSSLKKIKDKGVSVELNWDTPWAGARLTSITAVREWEQRGGNDTDWTSADIIYARGLDDNPGFTNFKTLSQEVRLAGETDRLNWLVGGFYSSEKLSQRVQSVTYGNQFEAYLNALTGGALLALSGRTALDGTLYPGGAGQTDYYDQDGDSFALFTNNSFKFTEQLELTVGARYTWESKDLESLWTNTGTPTAGCSLIIARLAAVGATIPNAAYPALCPTLANPRFAQIGRNTQSLDEEKFTGTVKLAYRFSPEVLAYASYARGYKAGGFNLDRIAPARQVNASGVATPGLASEPVLDTRFAPELVDSFELGVKNTLLDRTLLLNATVFYQDYKNFQLNAFNGLVFNVSSVPEVISKGFDADFLWFTPLDGLTLNGGVTYAETYYARSTPIAFGGNLPGSRLSLAPLWSGSLAVTYERPISDDLNARVALNAKSVSSYNTGSDLAPRKNQPGFTVVNGRIGINSQDRGWEAELWAQNLFDEVYYQVAFDAPFQSGSIDAFLGQRRTYGVTLRYKY